MNDVTSVFANCIQKQISKKKHKTQFRKRRSTFESCFYANPFDHNTKVDVWKLYMCAMKKHWPFVHMHGSNSFAFLNVEGQQMVMRKHIFRLIFKSVCTWNTFVLLMWHFQMQIIELNRICWLNSEYIETVCDAF